MEDVTVKIQFELPSDKVKEIDALMKMTGTNTRKEYFNNALTLLEWAIEERYKGNTIAAIDDKYQKVKELVMPILTAAAKAAR